MLNFFVLCLLLSATAARAENAAAFLQRVDDARPKTGLIYTMTVSGEDGSLTYTTFSQNGKWRMDGEHDGQKSRILFDGKKTVVILDKTGLEQNIDNFGAMPTKKEAEAFVLGRETVAGQYPCRMITNDSSKTTLCISERYGLPVFAQTPNFMMAVENIREEQLPEKTFAIPDDVQIISAMP